MPAPASPYEVRPEPPDSEVGDNMIRAFIAWARDTYPDYDPARSPSADPAQLEPPGGGFFVAWRGLEPIGCAGFKRLDTRRAEVKRLYVAPDARRGGAAAALMRQVEDEARALGYAALRLDLGDRQPAAMALYTGLGYRPVADYNGNPFATCWLEKALD